MNMNENKPKIDEEKTQKTNKQTNKPAKKLGNCVNIV